MILKVVTVRSTAGRQLRCCGLNIQLQLTTGNGFAEQALGHVVIGEGDESEVTKGFGNVDVGDGPKVREYLSQHVHCDVFGHTAHVDFANHLLLVGVQLQEKKRKMHPPEWYLRH
jgi:hypothetical protein